MNTCCTMSSHIRPTMLIHMCLCSSPHCCQRAHHHVVISHGDISKDAITRRALCSLHYTLRCDCRQEDSLQSRRCNTRTVYCCFINLLMGLGPFAAVCIYIYIYIGMRGIGVDFNIANGTHHPTLTGRTCLTLQRRDCRLGDGFQSRHPPSVSDRV